MWCARMSVCEPAAPSMSHFKVLSLLASWHLLTSAIIMLIYIVWLHKVIYAHFSSTSHREEHSYCWTFSWSRHSFLKMFVFDPGLLSLICFSTFSTRLLTSVRKFPGAPAIILRPSPGEKLIATTPNWYTLLCSWGEDGLGSLSRQIHFSSVIRDGKNVFCVESKRARDELAFSFIHC